MEQLLRFSLGDLKGAVLWLVHVTDLDLVRTFPDGGFEAGTPVIGGARLVEHQLRHLYFSPSGYGMVAVFDMVLVRRDGAKVSRVDRIAQICWDGMAFTGRFIK